MEKNHLLEGLKFLSTSHRNLHQSRQKYEWQIVFTVLAFYVLTVSAFYTKEIDLNEINVVMLIILICFVFFLLLIISLYFLRKLHLANSKNKQIAEYCDININKLVNNKEIDFKELKDIVDKSKPKYWDWALNWQMSTISLFAIISAVLIIVKLSA